MSGTVPFWELKALARRCIFLIFNRLRTGTCFDNIHPNATTVNLRKTSEEQTGIMTGTNKATVPDALYRIFQSNIKGNDSGTDYTHEKKSTMITKVTAKPNPFSTTITLDVTCEQSRHIIVRMFDAEGKIIKMFSWYVVKGTNVTAINELRSVHSGFYLLDIIDHEGNVLFSTELTKK